MEVNGLVEEVEALKSIYFRELEVTNDECTNVPTRISINLHPATAENTQEQYVCLTLVINLPLNYPNEIPEIVIRNPRGLSDEDFERIKTDLLVKANESQGNAMLYELIEIAKEHLTMGNTPRCSCAICLYGFTDADVFTKTDCYHYFHSHCLARYVKCVMDTPVSSNPLTVQVPDEEVKVLCPVCREPIECSPETLKAPPPLQSEGAAPFELDSGLVKLQQQMSELFDKQKSQGGIIDVEAEKNKYLLEISSVPAELDSGIADAFVRTEAKSTNHKSSKKELQRSSRKPVAQERDEQQQDRRPQRDNRRNQPWDKSVAAANGGQTNRQNHNRGRGWGYRTNRRPEDGIDGKYPIRSNQGRGHPEQMDSTAECNSAAVRNLNSYPRNSTETQQQQQQHSLKQTNGVNFRSPEGLSNHAGNSYRRPNYGQRGRGGGRWREEHKQPRGKSVTDEDTEEVEENGKAVPSSASGAKKMDWAEQVGEDDSPPSQPRTDLAPRRRGYNHAARGRNHVENAVQEDGTGASESRDLYRKRNNGYRNYRKWNQAPAAEKAVTLSSDVALAGVKAGTQDSCSDRSCSGSENIPVSRFMVLTGPPTMAFADSAINGLGDATGRCRRPPPGFLQAQPAAKEVDLAKTFAATLPPGFKTRSDSTTAAAPPPGFEAKM